MAFPSLCQREEKTPGHNTHRWFLSCKYFKGRGNTNPPRIYPEDKTEGTLSTRFKSRSQTSFKKSSPIHGKYAYKPNIEVAHVWGQPARSHHCCSKALRHPSVPPSYSDRHTQLLRRSHAGQKKNLPKKPSEDPSVFSAAGSSFYRGNRPKPPGPKLLGLCCTLLLRLSSTASG